MRHRPTSLKTSILTHLLRRPAPLPRLRMLVQRQTGPIATGTFHEAISAVARSRPEPRFRLSMLS